MAQLRILLSLVFAVLSVTALFAQQIDYKCNKDSSLNVQMIFKANSYKFNSLMCLPTKSNNQCRSLYRSTWKTGACKTSIKAFGRAILVSCDLKQIKLREIGQAFVLKFRIESGRKSYFTKATERMTRIQCSMISWW